MIVNFYYNNSTLTEEVELTNVEAFVSGVIAPFSFVRFAYSVHRREMYILLACHSLKDEIMFVVISFHNFGYFSLSCYCASFCRRSFYFVHFTRQKKMPLTD